MSSDAAIPAVAEASRDGDAARHQATELAAVRRWLDYSDGTFSLGFALCNRPVLRDALVADLRVGLERPLVVALTRENGDPFDAAEAAAADLPGPPSAVFLVGLEDAAPSTDRAVERHALRRFNASRDLWPRWFPCPVVVWMPDDLLARLPAAAPDLWRYRSHLFDFTSPLADPAAAMLASPRDYDVEGGDLTPTQRQFRIDELEQRIEAARAAGDGPLRPFLPRWLNELGALHLQRADLAAALAAFEEAERIDRAALGDDHPEVATRVNNVGSVLHARGDLAGALAKYEEAERIDRAALGDDHPNVAIRVNNAGSLLHARGDLAGALLKFEEAERIGRAALGDDHPKVAINVNNVGNVLHARGDLAGALAKYEEAERIDRAALGDDHPNVGRDVNNVGSVLQDRGDIAGALLKYEEAERIDRAAFGDDHPEVATDVNNAGSVLRARGDLAGALAKYEEAFAILLRAYGPRGEGVLKAAGNVLTAGGDPVALAKRVAGDETAEAVREGLEATRDRSPRP